MTDATLLFTDVVDSTQLVQRLGDEGAAALWLQHDRQARDLLSLHHGREIDRSDGFFLLFDHATDAARYALAYHQALAALELSARVGLHVGPVTLRDNPPEDIARGAKAVEVEGLAKPFAARVMALARGGQTLLSPAACAALAGALPDGSALNSAPRPTTTSSAIRLAGRRAFASHKAPLGALCAGSAPRGGLSKVAEPHLLMSHGHYRLKGIAEPVELFELGVPERSAFAPPEDSDKVYRVVRDGELWQPLRAIRHNLSAERDAFVGRTDELRALAQRLDDGARLISLLGPGGTGKTRLVRRYGRAWLGDWPGGVYFCDLSEARSLDGVLFAVAVALDVPLGKSDPVVQLGHAIAGRGRCLVILDNFEQVTAHAQATVGHWLDRASEAAFVVTSRERLHLAGEEVLAVEPLPLGKEALELFAARARVQRPGFALTEANRDAVAEVVRLLDGLPLAIELAAARVRVFSPAQLVQRLRDRFALLAGARGVSARQATLRAAIDWSWDLLAPWEQAALAQCSVFEGGFTIEAAEAVLDLSPWPDAPPVMDAVQALLDKSLLRSWVRHQHERLDIDEPYFGMYLSIHEYAAAKLDASAPHATPVAQQRHGRYFAGFGTDEAIEALSLRGGVARRRALALELENLVAACHRAIERSDPIVAAPSYRAMWEVMVLRGPFGPCTTLGARVFNLPGIGLADRVEVAVCRADALMRVGRNADANALLEQALVLAQGSSDRRLEGVVLRSLGQLHREQGNMHDAKHRMQAALAIFESIGDSLGQGGLLQNIGNLHDQQGSFAQSKSCHEAALAIYRNLGNRVGEGHVLASLGILSRHQGQMAQARTYYGYALEIHREVGDRRSEGIVLGNLGNVLTDQGHNTDGQAHYEASLAIHREVGSRVVEGYALANLGLVHQHFGRMGAAREHFTLALTICAEVANRFHEGVVLCYLSALEVTEGRMTIAAACVDRALRVNREVGNRLSEGIALGVLGDLLTQQGRSGEALKALRTGEAVFREIDNPFELALLLCIKSLAEIAANDLQSARTTLAEAERLAAQIGSTADSGLGRQLARVRESVS